MASLFCCITSAGDINQADMTIVYRSLSYRLVIAWLSLKCMLRIALCIVYVSYMYRICIVYVSYMQRVVSGWLAGGKKEICGMLYMCCMSKDLVLIVEWGMLIVE